MTLAAEPVPGATSPPDAAGGTRLDRARESLRKYIQGGGGFVVMNSAGAIQFCVNAATRKTLSAELPANATGAQITTAINLIRSLLVDVRLAS